VAHTHPLLEALVPRRRESLGDRLSSLTDDVAALARQIGRDNAPRIQEAAHAAGDMASDVLQHMAPIARDVAHRARQAGTMVRKDPLPAVVALGTLALIATLVMRRQ
jgi:hypothetical protein